MTRHKPLDDKSLDPSLAIVICPLGGEFGRTPAVVGQSQR